MGITSDRLNEEGYADASQKRSQGTACESQPLYLGLAFVLMGFFPLSDSFALQQRTLGFSAEGTPFPPREGWIQAGQPRYPPRFRGPIWLGNQPLAVPSDNTGMFRVHKHLLCGQTSPSQLRWAHSFPSREQVGLG
jgi:hypothetical protein